LPWAPIAFGFGVVAYFAAEREPSWIAATALAAGAVTAALLARRHTLMFTGTILVATAALGFAVASIKSALIAHPILDRPIYGASVKGFIEVREVTLQHTETGWQIERAIPAGTERPWAHVRERTAVASSAPPAADGSPQTDDLKPGD
jgi:competence protein ComEC